MSTIQESQVADERHDDHSRPHDPHAVAVQVHLLPSQCNPHERHATLHVGRQATLLDIMQLGAERFGVEILPSPTEPWDTLHSLRHGPSHPGPAIAELDQTLEEYLRHPGTTPDFGIRLELVFRVNTRWDISPSPELTPRQILTLPKIGLDPQDYSLYEVDSSEVLPADKPVKICHGSVFEAQKDGKYGGPIYDPQGS